MKWHLTSESLSDIIDAYDEGVVVIPEHQRPFIWKHKQQESLVETVARNMPIPNIILCETYTNGKKRRWVEDGQQRFMSLRKFVKGQSNDGGVLRFENKTFEELSIQQQCKFMNYKIGITEYWDATQLERETLFDRYQNGTPLTTGQRYWHFKNSSPLVKFAINTFMVPGCGLNTMGYKIWGKKDLHDDTARKLNLERAVNLCAGAAFGVEFITRSYDTIGPKLLLKFDEAAALDTLTTVLQIVDNVCKSGKYVAKERKKLWDGGNLVCYVLYALLTHTNIDWTEFVSATTSFQDLMNTLHANISKSRVWCPERWETGISNVQNVLHGNGNIQGVYDISSDDE